MTNKSEAVDTSPLKDLIIKRSSIKGQITKFKNYIDKVSKLPYLSAIEITELSLKTTKLETLTNKFSEIQDQIELLNSNNLQFELDERENIEGDFISCIASAKTLINKFNINDESRRQSFVASPQGCLDQENFGVKLPQIQISKFDGSYFKWLEFHDTFESLIHNNKNILTIHKFHYLNSYLEGEASRVIANLEMSSTNYAKAWQLLCDRYSNKRILVNHHLQSLFSMQPIMRESDKSLRFVVDHVTKNLRALSSLNQSVEQWDTLIIFMVCSKLDSQTLSKWEEHRNDYDDYPSLDQFYKFLTNRANVLESINRSRHQTNLRYKLNTNTTNNLNNYDKHNQHTHSQYRLPIQQTKTLSATNASNSNNNFSCIICNQKHSIYNCPTFISKSHEDKLADISKHKLCTNCLRKGHKVKECRLGPCRVCKGWHNTLLHNSNNTTVNEVDESIQPQSVVNFSEQGKYVLLSTALIEVCNPKTNKSETVRALLDCGSQSTIMKSSLAKRLSLSSHQANTKVVGIGNSYVHNVAKRCVAKLKSTINSYHVTLSCLVIDELTGELPKAPININQINIPKNIKLADPSFYKPASIDILIGADLFWDIVGCKQMTINSSNLRIIHSQLGWIVTGSIPLLINNTAKHTYTSNTNYCEIQEMLPRFWELEEIPKSKILSIEETKCEKHFLTNTQRLPNGRFSVRLPLKDSPDCLGDSYTQAKKRLLNLERRFHKNPSLKSEYADFIREYGNLGHLSESAERFPDPNYFLCHHAVVKESSESTRVRVVFDGSAPTSSGFSINDLMLVGPNIQDSLFSILIRARQYKYLLTGDIEKMYRQILVDEADRGLQLILWRENQALPIRTLQLNTLTYGTASASYLSTRCLWQIGEECDDEDIKTIIQRDFFVDDLITGCDSKDQLLHIQKTVTKVLSTACFNLRKFKSNLPDLGEKILSNPQGSLTISESSSTLGLGWRPSSDILYFPIKLISSDIITKRTIMSDAFKIFDPLGLLSPSIIVPKIILQLLWKAGIGWDEPVPDEIKGMWYQFYHNLPSISNLEIPRLVMCDSPSAIELHAFSDASVKAYGACIYIRSIDCSNSVTVRLLCAKSKVSRLQPLTIPRLELCAALLAARLVKATTDSLRYKPDRVYYWSDSSVVLSWINSDVSRLKTFVANRVGEIIELTSPHSWRYVPTLQNPADLVSRGVNPDRLPTLDLWWLGPSFLYKNKSLWPKLLPCNTVDLPEVKTTMCLHVFEPIIKIENYSKITKLIRIVAYVHRFIHNAKYKNKRILGNLQLEELNKAFHLLCRTAQQQSFPIEYNLLLKDKQIKPKSKILVLSPFMDEDKIIRVGGRIEASNYSYNKKHPILLDSSHHLTKLYFEREHLKNLHAGPQLLLSIVREVVWPINGRRLSRKVARNCMRCRRFQGKTLNPKMGDLPSQRIVPDFPFLSVGLDFAGPFYILDRKGRGAKTIKCYLCLFVCLRYKCVHLEAVSDLTKETFIMTFRRFVSRRGKPAEVFCDNGRNFVAAAKDLNKFLKLNNDLITEFATQEGIKFLFTPVNAPHFGGIWESGVRSAKYHIKRVMGNTHLTFEEISTLFAQVEAILNSRPLYPLSSSPNDFQSLSPGHFLIGRSLTALPAPPLESKGTHNLVRHARLEQIRQHFWRRWQREYICELQERRKWKTNSGTLTMGDLVLIKEDNLPPLCWRLGRVARLFPGPDGVSRVADINTTRGCVRRPLVKLCPLYAADEHEG